MLVAQYEHTIVVADEQPILTERMKSAIKTDGNIQVALWNYSAVREFQKRSKLEAFYRLAVTLSFLCW